MSYIDLGYSKLLYKNQPVPTETPEDIASTEIPILSGASIGGGVTRSSNGRITIKWEQGLILISDGAHNRVLIGDDGL